MRLIEITETQLDEQHPMTKMMLKAMDDERFSKKKEEEKCRGCGTTEPGARIRGLCKQCAEDTYADRD